MSAQWADCYMHETSSSRLRADPSKVVEGKKGEGVMRQTDRMRVLIGIRTKCGTSNNEGNWKGDGQGRPDRSKGVGGRWAGRWVGLGCVTKRMKNILQGSEGLTLMI